MIRIKKGTIISRDGTLSLFKHFGVYIGEMAVIHYEKRASFTSIEETSLEEFLEGKECYIEREPDSRSHAIKTVERAKSQVGRSSYSAFGVNGENCEHFANWCQYPELAISRQVSFGRPSFSYPCSECGEGRGTVSCPECDGEKSVDCECGDGEVGCPSCDGSGNATCLQCDSGSITCPASDCFHGKVSCESCYGTGSVDCQECEGDGYVEEECGYCMGDGCGHCDDTGTREVKCRSCKGKGISTCSDCEGTGKVDCEECFGTGMDDCPDCSGSSAADCPDCSGRGWVAHDACDGTGRVECDVCDGSGRVDCAHCGGSGDEPDPLKAKKAVKTKR